MTTEGLQNSPASDAGASVRLLHRLQFHRPETIESECWYGEHRLRLDVYVKLPQSVIATGDQCSKDPVENKGCDASFAVAKSPRMERKSPREASVLYGCLPLWGIGRIVTIEDSYGKPAHDSIGVPTVKAAAVGGRGRTSMGRRAIGSTG